MKNFLRTFVLLLIIFLSGVLGVFLWLNRPTGCIPPTGTEFQIKKGDTGYSIAARLYEDKFINSRELFVIITRIFRFDRKLKTGWIQLMPEYDLVNIINSIYNGNFVTVTFTVPEGSDIREIKKILVENNICDEKDIDDFLSDPDYPSKIGLPGYKSAEGFLFPDTYKFNKGIEPKEVFQAMVKLFFAKLKEIEPSYESLSRNELYDKIKMASILEREVKVPDEAPVVAGVFYNRIKRGMRLESCATVQYILNKPKAQLLDVDLEIDNPYNTYLYKGLPPTPICNPGYNSIKSSFFPASHDYLFFVVSDPKKGTHHFSKTYEEHVKYKNKYKKLEGFY